MTFRKKNNRTDTRTLIAGAAVLAGAAVGTALAVSRRLRNKAKGMAHQASSNGNASYDDVTLARKVESEIFRDADAPKGDVVVNAEHGVVFLRGQVESPEAIRELEDAARSVDGVKGVETLLHTPGTPAPMKS